MKIKIYVGYRNDTGEYVDVKTIDDLSKEDAKDYINKMQMQLATSVGFKKSPVAATTKGM